MNQRQKTNEKLHKKEYKILFETKQKLVHKDDVSYEDLLKYTIEMMKFANATGITKISKMEDEDAPGGAEYE